jgi:ribosomal protein S18 acetylase RimI-like enzyme
MLLSTLAGWNQTESDWKLLLNLEPEGCFGLECAGHLVATTTLVCYGDRLAWLGMVLTHPEYRRRGFARQLVGYVLKIAESKGIRAIKLDATEQGLPLYESVGFRREQEIERWSGTTRAAASAIPNAPAASPRFELDRKAYGADRTRLLSLLAGSGHVAAAAEDGFVMSRPGAHAAFLGPCVARCTETAQLLIEQCFSGRDGVWFWDLLPANNDAIQIAKHLGFQPRRRLVRMVKGQDVVGCQSMIYAGGGFEFG